MTSAKPASVRPLVQYWPVEAQAEFTEIITRVELLKQRIPVVPHLLGRTGSGLYHPVQAAHWVSGQWYLFAGGETPVGICTGWSLAGKPETYCYALQVRENYSVKRLVVDRAVVALKNPRGKRLVVELCNGSYLTTADPHYRIILGEGNLDTLRASLEGLRLNHALPASVRLTEPTYLAQLQREYPDLELVCHRS